jgi:hypothetical protein
MGRPSAERPLRSAFVASRKAQDLCIDPIRATFDSTSGSVTGKSWSRHPVPHLHDSNPWARLRAALAATNLPVSTQLHRSIVYCGPYTTGRSPAHVSTYMHDLPFDAIDHIAVDVDAGESVIRSQDLDLLKLGFERSPVPDARVLQGWSVLVEILAG